MAQFEYAPAEVASELSERIAESVRRLAPVSRSVISFSEQVATKVAAIAEPRYVTCEGIIWTKFAVRQPLPGHAQIHVYGCCAFGKLYTAVFKRHSSAKLMLGTEVHFMATGKSSEVLGKFSKLIVKAETPVGV